MFPHTKSTGQTGREFLCQVPVWCGLNLFCRTVSCLSNVCRHLKVVPHAKTPTFYVGCFFALVLRLLAKYEEHRTNRKGAFVSGSRLARAQFVLPNRFVFFRRSPALESCSACENPHVLRGVFFCVGFTFTCQALLAIRP